MVLPRFPQQAGGDGSAMEIDKGSSKFKFKRPHVHQPQKQQQPRLDEQRKGAEGDAVK